MTAALRFLPLLFLCSVMLLCEPLWMVLAGSGAVLWHEMGHLLCFPLARCPMPRLRSDWFGLRLMPATPLRIRQELLIALGGPAANLLFGILCFCLPISSGMAERIGAVHLLTAFFNLMPLGSMDGNRILRCLLCLVLPYPTARMAAHMADVFFCAFLFFCASFLFYFAGWGIYGVIFSLFSFWNSTKSDFGNLQDFERKQEKKREKESI